MAKLWRLLTENYLKIGVGLIIAFTALYPKLPSIHVNHTWVYIRLEDFLIGVVVILWAIAVLRRKVKLVWFEGLPIVVYWIVGLASLVISILFIGPHLANYFPSVAVLSYFRRIEYMILFFVALSTIKQARDLKFYLIFLFITVFLVDLYGLGQRFYLYLWHYFPSFFEAHPFCFPSFQTGNEEFAKGIPLCLPEEARITSTFGGHYDLAAYLVLITPIIISILFVVKRFFEKVILFVLSILSVTLLILTSSRISFVAYLIGVSFGLWILKKKRFILPVVVVSIVILFVFSGSTVRRFAETIRFTNVVTNNQGEVIGETLPDSLKSKISKNPIIESAPPPSQNLPIGSSFLTLPQQTVPVATSVAVVKTKLSPEEAKRLKLENGGVEISTVSGSFLVQKALVYDISFTTRIQGEWPHTWAAFTSYPLLGEGFSSVTLANDNDYLRLLGETGILGFVSFLGIFLMLGILVVDVSDHIPSKINKGYVYGLSGGLVGLLINAFLIDVFEASKVAEPFWILMGIGVGVLILYKKKVVDYMYYFKKIFASHFFLSIYLTLLGFIEFSSKMQNFFVGDDFTWLKWSATAAFSDLKLNFLNANGFFYRPIAKDLMMFLYTFFAFEPSGYHLFNVLLHLASTIGVYALCYVLFGRKLWAVIAAGVFMFLPSHAENLFWISTLSINFSNTFVIFSILGFILARLRGSIVSYIWSFVFAVVAIFSYEGAIVLPILFFSVDAFYLRRMRGKWIVWSYIPFVALAAFYLFARWSSHAIAPGGDYSVSIPHFVPNFVGNLLGYLSLFLTGEYSLPFYAALRDNLRTHQFLAGMLLLVGAIVLVTVVWRYKKKTVEFYQRNNLVVFAIVFIVVALLPFVGLGNIAERYSYLASVGFVILVGFVVGQIQRLVQKYASRGASYFVLLVMCGLFIIMSSRILSGEYSEWYEAGKITQRTLSYFRIYYDGLPKDTHLYFVNVPIRKANAWIFPVGLSDGLWFIYRELNIFVEQASDVSEAHRRAVQLSSKAYIFYFDKNYNVNYYNN